MNASVQIKTHSHTSARNKNTHILRNSEAYENSRIIVLYDNDLRNFQKPKKEKPAKAVLKNEAERKSELKKINSAVSVYQNRIDALLPKNEQDEIKKRKELLKALRKQNEALRGEERKAIKEIIKDEEKSLETVRNGFIQSIPQALASRVLKLQEKLSELFEKRESFKEAKKIPETRGREQKNFYVEFIFSITNSSEYRNDEEFVEVFAELQNKFLRAFKGLELKTNAVHLDQFSVHSHALLRLPDETSWEKYFSQFRAEDGRDFYKQMAKTWHSLVKTALFKNFGITLENQTSGKRYKSLKTFKKENPIQNHEKEEKINSERDMSDLSDISPQFRKLLESAKANHELANSLFSNGKSTQSESSSNQQVAEAQPSSSSNPNPQKRAKRN